jgi:hypothetical protein
MSDNSTASEPGEGWTDDMIYQYYCSLRAEAAVTDPSWYAAFALFGLAAIPFIFVVVQTLKKVTVALRCRAYINTAIRSAIQPAYATANKSVR